MDNRINNPSATVLEKQPPGFATGGSTSAFPPQRTFLGHPIGLYVLFFTEMWERFSYYGMRALLMLYMLNFLKMGKDASTIYKVYTSFVYVTPILGGYLADRFLGNKKAVIIGAVLMAIGHFLMAFDTQFIFYSALIFLIFGNGMFKPNMSTQVGRLYATNDGRRDGAYTIFYMGINLGAFMAPIVCGWLEANTVGGYHSGFTMAGIGMVFGLLIYLLGQPFIRELPADAILARPTVEKKKGDVEEAMSEAQAAGTSSSLGGFLASAVVKLLAGAGLLLLVAAPLLFLMKKLDQWHTNPLGQWEGWQRVAPLLTKMDQWDAIMLAIGGGCLLLIAYVASQVIGGVRDRVLTILVLGVFVMFFWGAFEQAGNVLNIWADKHTERSLWQPPKPIEIVPKVVEDAPKAGDQKVGFLDRFRNMFQLKEKPDENAGLSTWERVKKWFDDSFNPMPTAWFQSINALAIFVLAPVFAILWVKLDKRGMQPSIPMKMAFGLFMMSASVGVMILAAQQEDRPTSVALKTDRIPEGISVGADGTLFEKDKPTEPYHAGRILFDTKEKTLRINGILPDDTRDEMIEATAPEPFRKKVEELKKLSEGDVSDEKPVEVKLDEIPNGFEMKFAGLKKSVVTYVPEEKKLIAYQKLENKEVKGLLKAAGEPGFRDTLNNLYVETNPVRVSPWWLFWSYILATLGELCLSPVGLSMVSKLAPVRFSTMLMGVWMLTSAFGNFAAGALGEYWGTIPPVRFFMNTTVIVAVAALVLLLLTRVIVKMMHGVR